MGRGIRKILAFVKLQIASKIFGKIIQEPKNFEKTPVALIPLLQRPVLKIPGMTIRNWIRKKVTF